MKNKIPNIGWLYFKNYYRNLADAMRKEPEKKPKDLPLGLDKINETIVSQYLSHQESHWLKADLANCSFAVKTQYPGLLAGLGAQHSIGHEEEFKLGFSFDYTTGLPYLPASSVKGLLRSYFPSRLLEAAGSCAPGSPEKRALEKKAEKLSKLLTAYLLPQAGFAKGWSPENLLQLEKNLFEGILPASGTPVSLYERDLFFDAYPAASHFKGKEKDDEGRFLAFGAITPHGKNPLKEPTPLRLLKILPEVVFQFQFRLTDTEINGQRVSIFHKFQLFQSILTSFGLGAKTNVGYGRVKKVE